MITPPLLILFLLWCSRQGLAGMPKRALIRGFESLAAPDEHSIRLYSHC